MAGSRYNRFGELLDDNQEQEVVSDSYLGIDGKPNWLKDGNKGFDITKPRERIILKKGEIILRYGDEGGSYAAPLRTPYKNLAMPYRIATCEYNEYEVVEDNAIIVEVVRVDKGTVGRQPAWPDEPGGGIQYHFYEPRKNIHYYAEVVQTLRQLGVSEWSPLMKEDKEHQ